MNRRFLWCFALCIVVVFTLLSLGGTALGEEYEPYTLVTDDWIVRGSDLYVVVMPLTGATKYEISVVDGTSRNTLYTKTTSSTGFVTIPAAKFPASGFYDIMVWAMDSSSGIIDGAWKTIVVFDQPLSGSDEIFYISDTSVQVNDQLMYYVYVPGAERVGVVGLERYSSELNTGDFKAYCTQISEPGVYEFHSIAVFPDGSTTLGEATTVTVTAPYNLGDFSPVIPSTVNKGKDLKFTVTPASNAASLLKKYNCNTSYDISVYDATDGGEILYKTYGQAGDGGLVALGSSRTITVSASKLTPGHLYEVCVDAYCYGCESIRVQQYVYVKDTVNADIQLSINGSTGSVDAQIGDTMTVRAKLTDPDRNAQLRLGQNEYPIYNTGNENWPADGIFFTNFSLDEDGVFPAFIQCSDDDTDWSTETSNIVTVNVTSTGVAEMPVYQMPDSVCMGDFLKIDITEAGPDSRYDGYIAGTTGDFYQNFDEDYYFDGSFYVDTSRMSPGLYKLYMTHRTPGKRPADKVSWFQVTAPEAGGDAFRFKLLSDHINLDQSMLFSFYAPGADHIRVFTHNVNDIDDPETHGPFGLYYNDPTAIPFYSTGRYDVYARAYTDYGEETYEESEHFTVIVSSLGITPGSLECPGLVQSGQDVVIALGGIDNADDGWEFRVWDTEGGFSEPVVCFGSYNTVAISSYTLKGDLLQPGKSYSARLDIKARGYDYGYYEVSFYVYNQLDDNIVVTVDGGASAQCLINEYVTVRIEAPGATDLEWFTGSYWNQLYDFDPDTGVFESALSFDSPGSYTILARACYDGSGEMGEASNPAVLKVICYGQVGELYGEVLTPVVQRSDMLRVRINEAENASAFAFELEYEEDDMHYVVDTFEVKNAEAPLEVSIPVAELEPRNHYSVRIVASAPGYQTKVIQEGNLLFDVVEPENEASFQVSNTELIIGEKLFFTAYSSEYEYVTIRLGEDIISWSTSDHYSYGEYTFDRPGTYTLSAWADVDGEDNVQIGEDITILVIDKPPLRAPKLSGPSIVLTSEWPPVFTVSSVLHATQYIAEIEQDGHWCATLSLEKPGPLNLDIVTPEPGKVYSIRMTATAPGYANGEGEAQHFALVDDDKVLTLPSGLTAIGENAFEGIDAQLIVLPSGIRSVEPGAFADCRSLVAVIVPAGAQGIDEQAFQGCADDLVVTEAP